jgi:hypothetical protein
MPIDVLKMAYRPGSRGGPAGAAAAPGAAFFCAGGVVAGVVAFFCGGGAVCANAAAAISKTADKRVINMIL